LGHGKGHDKDIAHLSHQASPHVLTSCGTCIDQLMTYELGDIFKDASLTDIHEYLYEMRYHFWNTIHYFLVFGIQINPVIIDSKI
jgi:hypothetical protein